MFSGGLAGDWQTGEFLPVWKASSSTGAQEHFLRWHKRAKLTHINSRLELINTIFLIFKLWSYISLWHDFIEKTKFDLRTASHSATRTRLMTRPAQAWPKRRSSVAPSKGHLNCSGLLDFVGKTGCFRERRERDRSKLGYNEWQLWRSHPYFWDIT